ncbi:type VI secretion system baseplate subunit TssE [Massilia arenosa]|uniref:Type VI secretion system baseplate subunit TssE n=1 Tax=Zemynaea arenosa TaxID=2561931 RepID=A0A4Y9SGI8_9BURK|nr:type VI secretion system baseplate subunit TssE [Massilia arenosa]TFW23162.1 type VI secretion system baseplate subunit TssE [Massilia arenosa]
MNSLRPSLFDRLFGSASDQLTLEQYKDSVARDLEALLNTRLAILPEMLAPFPHCQNSVLHYGLVDFAGLCLSSDDDRKKVCASLKDAIERHEPRLDNVQATLEAQEGSVNRLSFVITATLKDTGLAEPVNFNAVLQPSSLRYSITRSRHGHQHENPDRQAQ